VAVRLTPIRLAVVLSLAAFGVLAGNAAADQAFHTLHADLHSVGGAPLQSGFVNDIHTNGVVNGAHEIYHLNGASPGTTYQVTILFYVLDPSCSSTPATFPTAQLTTNGVGNATAKITFPAGPPSPLAGTENGIRWQLTGPGGLAYETDCHLLTLD
jgi:hypothetical protein